MNKKKKLIVLIVFLLSIVLCCYLVVDKILSNKDKIMVCINEKEDENNKYIFKYILNIDKKTLQVLNEKFILSITYFNKNDYTEMKKLKKESLNNVKFDDSKKKYTEIKNDGPIKDSDGNNVIMWYTDYRKMLEKDGYECKLK